jgi:hypothetical protein
MNGASSMMAWLQNAPSRAAPRVVKISSVSGRAGPWSLGSFASVLVIGREFSGSDIEFINVKK